ncbi:hypothetical protein [Streptomyces sp. B6B3]|uniref:hypothetical protein n=1 Tax=Streptomyces sp. B6B3 TaxID=3153570 RepID=UPI00325EAFB7
MNGASTLLIVLGLFLLGGVYSFRKQGMPRSVVLVLGIGSALCLLGGALRLEV